jgi:hypothetical protein
LGTIASNLRLAATHSEIRRSPDHIGKTYTITAQKAAGGGEEMLRLRTYEKLQNLVRAGQVKKTGKKYKGVAKALLLLSESLKEYRKNGPSFSRRLSLAPKPL